MLHLIKKCVRHKELKNKVFACFDLHSFRMSECRVCLESYFKSTYGCFIHVNYLFKQASFILDTQ